MNSMQYDLSAKRKMIEESLRLNDLDRKAFYEQHHNLLDESEEISDSAFSSSQSFNESDPRHWKYSNIPNPKAKKKQGDQEIQEAISARKMEDSASSSDLDYSQSNMISQQLSLQMQFQNKGNQKKQNNNGLGSNIFNNSGIEEFSFQGSQLKDSNLFKSPPGPQDNRDTNKLPKIEEEKLSQQNFFSNNFNQSPNPYLDSFNQRQIPGMPSNQFLQSSFQSPNQFSSQVAQQPSKWLLNSQNNNYNNSNNNGNYFAPNIVQSKNSDSQQEQSSGFSDLNFFKVNKTNKEIEKPLDLKKQYEAILQNKLQSPDTALAASQLLKESPPFKQQTYQKQMQEAQRNRDQLFQNQQQAASYRIPSKQEESLKNSTNKSEFVRSHFEDVLQDHMRKYSPHSKVPQTSSLNQPAYMQNNLNQIDHLKGLYTQYQQKQRNMNLSSSESSSDDEQSIHSMGSSVKNVIQKAIAQQNKNKIVKNPVKEFETTKSLSSDINLANKMQDDIEKSHQSFSASHQSQNKSVHSQLQQEDDDQEHHHDEEELDKSDQIQNSQLEQSQIRPKEDKQDDQEKDEEEDNRPEEVQDHLDNKNLNEKSQEIPQQEFEDLLHEDEVQDNNEEESQKRQEEEDNNFQNDEDKYKYLKEVISNIGSELGEPLFSELVNELYATISNEKEKDQNEERQQQYEILLTKLLNIPQSSDQEVCRDEDIKDVIDVEQLLAQITQEKKEEDDEKGQNQELAELLDQLDLKLQEICKSRNELKKSLSKHSEHKSNSIEQLQASNKSIENIPFLDDQPDQVADNLIDKIQEYPPADYLSQQDAILRRQSHQSIRSPKSSKSHNTQRSSHQQIRSDHQMLDLQKEEEDPLILEAEVPNHDDQLNESNKNEAEIDPYQIVPPKAIQQKKNFLQRQNTIAFDQKKDPEKTKRKRSLREEKDLLPFNPNNYKKKEMEIVNSPDAQSQKSQSKQSHKQSSKHDADSEDEEKFSQKDLIDMIEGKSQIDENNPSQVGENYPDQIVEKEQDLIQDPFKELNQDNFLEDIANQKEDFVEDEKDNIDPELEEIKERGRIKREIQDLIKGKKDVFDKFKYKLEMQEQDIDVSWQSELNFEDSLKHSQLYKNQNLLNRKQSDTSDKSAPVSKQKDNQLDRTLSDKLKNELFLDLENFRKSDVFRLLGNRRLQEMANRYLNKVVKNGVSNLCRNMRVIASVNKFIEDKQIETEKQVLKVFKWYNNYSKVKRRGSQKAVEAGWEKEMKLKRDVFNAIKKSSQTHKKWIKAVRNNLQLMRSKNILKHWNQYVIYKNMLRQADIYYKQVQFRKFKDKIYELRHSSDGKALTHYSNKLAKQFFNLLASTTKKERNIRQAVEAKYKELNYHLLMQAFKEWQVFTDKKKSERDEYIPIQICIKETISKPKILPNQSLKEYKKVPVTTQKSVKVFLPSHPQKFQNQ